MGAVLGEDAVAGLPLTELPLDDPEGMLDLGPDDGDEAVQLCVERIQRSVVRCLADDAPTLARALEHLLARGADIALAGRDGGVLAVQFVPDLAVGHRRSRGIKSVGHAAVGIHAHVRIHGKIPVVALLRR